MKTRPITFEEAKEALVDGGHVEASDRNTPWFALCVDNRGVMERKGGYAVAPSLTMKFRLVEHDPAPPMTLVRKTLRVGIDEEGFHSFFHPRWPKREFAISEAPDIPGFFAWKFKDSNGAEYDHNCPVWDDDGHPAEMVGVVFETPEEPAK